MGTNPEPIVIDIETTPNMNMLGYMPDFFDVPEFTVPTNVKKAETIERKKAEKFVKWLSDAAIKHDQWIAKMALDMDYAQITAIGIGIGLDTEPQTFIVHNEEEEREILSYAWGLIGYSWAPVIGYNLIGFDLPILKRRAWTLGIKPEGPRMIEINRYSKELIDLKEWSFWLCCE